MHNQSKYICLPQLNYVEAYYILVHKNKCIYSLLNILLFIFTVLVFFVFYTVYILNNKFYSQLKLFQFKGCSSIYKSNHFIFMTFFHILYFFFIFPVFLSLAGILFFMSTFHQYVFYLLMSGFLRTAKQCFHTIFDAFRWRI